MLGNGDLQRAANFWSSQTDVSNRRKSWGDFPTVKRNISRRITGTTGLANICEAMLDMAFQAYGIAYFEEGVSIGSGLCNKEMHLLLKQRVGFWDCFEISTGRVDAARARARELGVEHRIALRNEDAFSEQGRKYDLVFWSQSLHHMPDIGAALAWSLDRLNPGGVLGVDEFTGANRFQWSDDILQICSEVRSHLPERLLRARNGGQYPRRMSRPSATAVIEQDPTESTFKAKMKNSWRLCSKETRS